MPLPLPQRYNVLGIGVSALTLSLATKLILGARQRPRTGYICLATAHGIIASRADPELRRVYNSSWLTTPDGMPLVWLGPPGVDRVYGPDLMLSVCDAGREVGLRHFFLGGKPGVASELTDRLTRRFPGLEVVGTYTPPFTDLSPGDVEIVREAIAATRPDVVWVGISAPKQERFMAQYHRHFEAPLLIGVGAAFDFHSGRVRQAPRWIQRSGFEWLFRLATEPRRLGPRYFTTIPRFLWHVLLQRTGLRSYPLPSVPDEAARSR